MSRQIPRGRALFAALVLTATAWMALAVPAHAAPAAINLDSSSCPATVRQGENDGCVVELQNLLNRHGQSVTADGSFGPATLGAVRVFQSEAGLSVDGLVGPATKQALYDADANTPATNLYSSACAADISQGATGGCVVELQNLLNDQGAHLAVDGQFGTGTAAAVTSFQSAHGLTVDGIVGPDTKDALYNGTRSSSGAVNLLSASCPANMSEDEADGCVITLQSLLNAHGQAIAVDGDFGPDTLAAVEAFQSAQGLSVDGIVGPNTKAALYANVGTGTNAPSPLNLTSAACPANISQGEHDGCVTELQSLLNQHGANLVLDGSFGPVTFAAVESFQSSQGLSVDGIVGPNTKSALYGSTIILTDCVIPVGYTTCTTGSTLGAEAAAEAHWLFDAPTSAQQAAAQANFKKRYGFSSLGDIPYVYGGGHGAAPGPSVGFCDGTAGTSSGDGWLYNNSTGSYYCFASHHRGLDCSGLQRLLYALAAGKDVLNGATYTQVANSHLTTTSNPQPGDLAFFYHSGASGPHHVAMAMGIQYVVSADNPSSPSNPLSPPLTGTGPAVFEEWFTGSSAGLHLLSQHSETPIWKHWTG